jgi:hypothetical protein
MKWRQRRSTLLSWSYRHRCLIDIGFGNSSMRYLQNSSIDDDAMGRIKLIVIIALISGRKQWELCLRRM